MKTQKHLDINNDDKSSQMEMLLLNMKKVVLILIILTTINDGFGQTLSVEANINKYGEGILHVYCDSILIETMDFGVIALDSWSISDTNLFLVETYILSTATWAGMPVVYVFSSYKLKKDNTLHRNYEEQIRVLLTVDDRKKLELDTETLLYKKNDEVIDELILKPFDKEIIADWFSSIKD